jgi:hypothetical protein
MVVLVATMMVIKMEFFFFFNSCNLKLISPDKELVTYFPQFSI